ncbi:hypothetical protein GCM10010234_75740 [Streptomyces hawaiiensis]
MLPRWGGDGCLGVLVWCAEENPSPRPMAARRSGHTLAGRTDKTDNTDETDEGGAAQCTSRCGIIVALAEEIG